MTQEELNKILKQHKLWLDSNGTMGKQANLSYANLGGANLRCAVLTNAILSSANLCDADLKCANLSGADLSGAILSSADLKYANLISSILRNASLVTANLSYAYLHDANLSAADLNGANLSEAVLDEKERIRKGIILQEEMIGWKKCRDNVLVRLEISRGAIVFSINNDKCRTNKAKVAEIIGSTDNFAISKHDVNFIYRLDEMVEVEDFDCQYNVECGSGIHFFRTKEEAINY